MQFKKLPKNIIEEGITIDLLEEIMKSGKLSPVMFQKGDEPVDLVRCNKESYWVKLKDGSYLIMRSEGMPLIYSTKSHSEDDMAVLKKFFSKDNIEATIETIKDRSHIDNVARFKVQERYIWMDKYINQIKQ